MRIPNFETLPGTVPAARSGSVNALGELHLRWAV